MMSETKFTPGPWKIYRTSDGSAVLGIGDAESGGVTDPRFGLWRDGTEKEANAHLIAAAPDLYAALEMANEFAETANEWFGRDASGEAQLNNASAMHKKAFYVLERIDAAITKARGEA